MTDREKRVTAAALISLVIVVVDQVTKQMILEWLPLDSGYEVIPGFMNIVHARNPGAAFGIPGSRWFFIAASVLAVMVIGWLIAKTNERDSALLAGYSLFLGGALGNLIDRVRLGEVIDFLDFYAGRLHWPAFNVADSALCAGTALFFIHVLRNRPK